MQQIWERAAGIEFASSSARRKTVLVASNHNIIRHGLQLMLRAATPHRIAEDNRPLRHVSEMIAQSAADIVIADLSTGDDGVDELRRAFAPANLPARLILVCQAWVPNGPDPLARAAGAIVTPEEDPVELLDAVRELSAQSPTPDLFRNVMEQPIGPLPEDVQQFHVTPREREVIELITQGLCSKRIARTLNISVTTVRTHRQRLMTKLGLRNSIEVAQFAAKAFGGGPLAR